MDDSSHLSHNVGAEVLVEHIEASNTAELSDVASGSGYHCEKCKRSFPDDSQLSSHQCHIFTTTSFAVQTSNWESGPDAGQGLAYNCPLCSKAFALARTLKQHFQSHRSEPKAPAWCSEPGCSFSSGSWRAYQRHMSAAHDLRLVPCSHRMCRLAFRTQVEMETHRRGHFPFHCTCCDFVTTSARQLNEHRRVHESLAVSKGGERGGEKEMLLAGVQLCVESQACSAGSQSQEEEEHDHRTKRSSEPERVDEAPHTADPKDRHFKSYIAEGTEHLYRTHICTECRRCFKKRTHLLEHLHLHFPDPNLQCPTCQRHFTSKSKLRVHMLREAGHKPHRCHLCDYGAVERNSLRRHLASVHGGEASVGADMYPCPACGETFVQSRALKAHMKGHHASPAGTQLLVCFQEGCPFQASDKRALQRHSREAHGVEAVACRHHACSALFGSQEAMEAHRRTHLAFHCPHCDFSCSNKSSFQRHRRQGHPGAEELRCHFCPFATFNPVEFKEHVARLHANEKTHRCPQCDFITAHKRVLGRHLLLHTGEKPHKCKLCDFRCRDETYLSKHMLTHSNDKNHMCSECGYVTKWKHYLNVHMRKHAGDLRYQCDQCSYRCHRSDQLSSHKLRHQEKSLICEVCAFSCKRKYELRRHMRLKHSSGDLTALLFQCKYCPYQTQYRQALHNHENCKHTRHREFCCALCSYITFSSTSLFLHKRKVHGYVPGDKAWLNNYAEKERENCSNAPDLLGSFVDKQPACVSVDSGSAENSSGSQEVPEVVRNSSQSMDISHHVDKKADIGENVCQDASPDAQDDKSETGTGKVSLGNQESIDTLCRQKQINELSASHQATDDQEDCCTLVLTSIADTECTEGTNAPGNSENVDPKMLPARRQSPTHVSERCSEDEEMDVTAEDDGDPSDGEGTVVPSDEGSLKASSYHPSGLCKSQRLEKAETGESFCSESRLMALRRRDKEQAEALVLEGRVQMLVVQAKTRMYRCDRCFFATHTQAALAQHRRLSCRGKRTALQCKDCGASYKQQRGLDTHRLKKCPALLKKGRRLSGPTVAAPPEVHNAPTQDGAGLACHNSKAQNSHTLVPYKKNTAQLITVHAEPRRDEVESNLTKIHNFPSNSNEQESRMTSRLETARNTEYTDLMKRYVLGEKGLVKTQRYSQVDGRFKCRNCHFSSCRVTTIERHCDTCSTRKTAEQKPAQMTGINEAEREWNDTQGCVENEGSGEEEGGEEVVKERKAGPRFSCSSCAFTCHQKRALDSHHRRGCLKPSEVQCKHCSFVAKSREALNRHTQVHAGKRLPPATRGKRAHLQCDLCPFTCKQARCLAQHVALKHEGVRPHQCRFCSFSTTRRYRLEAHESLHTGVGRLACHLCKQTFGTTSKLRLHQQRVHERRPTHFCSLCDYGGYSPNDVARHTLSCHTGALEHTCDLCTARFSSSAALKQHHRRQHQDPSGLPCPQCDFTSRSQSTLTAHLRRQHPRLECPTCRTGFQTREALEEHRRMHLNQHCPVCPFAACGRQLLAQHLLDEHEDGPPEDKLLKCSACDFACRHRLVLEQHVRSHGGSRIYRCTDCQYSTRNRQKITWHIRIHTGEKPYRCEQCSYACADPSRLKYHMRIHQEERKYLCPECGYKCKWVNQLKYHMTKHTGAKPYVCKECDYRTNRADALRVHCETRHRDVRSFICEKCGKGFKTRFLLRTHQRRHSEARPYVCRVCRRAFRWPAGLRHHFLTHTQHQPFHCRHCPYRARQRFQVVKHLRRHHPDQSAEQGVGRDLGPQSVSLRQAQLGEEGEVHAPIGVEQAAQLDEPDREEPTIQEDRLTAECVEAMPSPSAPSI